jgi:hypothetical protein
MLNAVNLQHLGRTAGSVLQHERHEILRLRAQYTDRVNVAYAWQG